MKNRTVLGLICILVALVITFAVAPLVNRVADKRIDIVRMKNDVSQGYKISEEDIETVSVGAYNLPSDIITRSSDVIGKYASCDLMSGDWLTPSKLSEASDSADDIFRTLDGTKQAISITISSFAGGLSGKLENGDIISLIVYDKSLEEALIPPELTYVLVITTTTADGFDKDELSANDDGTYDLPTTVTLLVNSEQAKLLTMYENTAKIHADLVYRGDDETAKKFLDAQDEYFARVSPSDTSSENESAIDKNAAEGDLAPDSEDDDTDKKEGDA